MTTLRKEIIIASANEGKISEIKNIFSDLELKILSLSELDDVPEIIENGDSFEANAGIKARIIFEKFKIPSIGDDSGLAVEQLDGRPGILSARYAGEDASDILNNIKLLTELQKFSEPHLAKFICAAVYYDGKNEITRKGEVNGKIIKFSRGTNGFGYDPIFVPDGFNQTLAELSAEVKNKISHRAKAFEEMKVVLKRLMNI